MNYLSYVGKYLIRFLISCKTSQSRNWNTILFYFHLCFITYFTKIILWLRIILIKAFLWSDFWNVKVFRKFSVIMIYVVWLKHFRDLDHVGKGINLSVFFLSPAMMVIEVRLGCAVTKVKVTDKTDRSLC